MSEKKEIVMNGAGVAELGFPGWPQFCLLYPSDAADE